MIIEDTNCIDVLRQTYAKAIEKLEAILLENHLHSCFPESTSDGSPEAMIEELVQLYNLAGNR